MINIFCFILIFLLVYFIVLLLISLVLNCTLEESRHKLADFFNEDTKTQYAIFNDSMLINDVWISIKAIIGDTRFNQMKELNKTSSLFLSIPQDMNLLGFTIICNDDERIQIENTVKKLISNKLYIMGMDDRVLSKWGVNEELLLPMLQIKYASTPEESKMVSRYLDLQKQKIISANLPLTDDEEDLLNE